MTLAQTFRECYRIAIRLNDKGELVVEPGPDSNQSALRWLELYPERAVERLKDEGWKSL